MKINLAKPLFDLEGKEIKNEKDRVVIAKDIILQTLLSAGQDEKDGNIKYKRFCLLNDINKTEKEYDISMEEILDLKTLIASVYGVLIYGQMVNILEGK